MTGNGNDTAGERLNLRSRMSELTHLYPWIERLASRLKIPASTQFAMNLCLEEALSNIIRHGYSGKPDHSIAVHFTSPREDYFVFVVEDEAPPFNPVDSPELPALSSLEDISDRRPGRTFVAAVCRRARIPGDADRQSVEHRLQGQPFRHCRGLNLSGGPGAIARKCIRRERRASDPTPPAILTSASFELRGSVVNLEKGEESMPTITVKDGTEIYFQGLGKRAARRLQPWLAPERGRLGRPDAVSGRPRLPLHRA